MNHHSWIPPRTLIVCAFQCILLFIRYATNLPCARDFFLTNMLGKKRRSDKGARHGFSCLGTPSKLTRVCAASFSSFLLLFLAACLISAKPKESSTTSECWKQGTPRLDISTSMALLDRLFLPKQYSRLGCHNRLDTSVTRTGVELTESSCWDTSVHVVSFACIRKCPLVVWVDREHQREEYTRRMTGLMLHEG